MPKLIQILETESRLESWLFRLLNPPPLHMPCYYPSVQHMLQDLSPISTAGEMAVPIL